MMQNMGMVSAPRKARLSGEAPAIDLEFGVYGVAR